MQKRRQKVFNKGGLHCTIVQDGFSFIKFTKPSLIYSFIF